MWSVDLLLKTFSQIINVPWPNFLYLDEIDIIVYQLLYSFSNVKAHIVQFCKDLRRTDRPETLFVAGSAPIKQREIL